MSDIVAVVAALVDANPLSTMVMFRERLAVRGIHISTSTIQRLIRLAGRSFQAVSWRTPPRDMTIELDAFFAEYNRIVANGDIVMSIDETGVLSNRYTTRGYGVRGDRLRVTTRHQKRFKTTSIVAICNNEEAFVDTFAGNATGRHFQEFVKVAFANAAPGTVAIMDNIAFHKSAAVRLIAEEHGVRLLFTPSYSPECNPVENFFSVFKNTIRRELLRRESETVEDFEAVVKATLEDVVDAQTLKPYFGDRTRETRRPIHVVKRHA
jgi:transposase